MSDDKLSCRLTIEKFNEVPFIFVDYTGLKEKDMIELITRHRALTLETHLPFLADFNKTFATPGYMLHAREFVAVTKSVNNKGALLGIDQVKSFLLKGVLMVHNVNYKAFNNRQDAIEFLTNADVK